VSIFPSVENDIGESDREGVELTARVELGAIGFGGSYTHLDATDPDGTGEVGRPKDQASFDVTGHFAQNRATVTAGVVYNGRMLDTDFRNYFANGFVAEKTSLGSHTVVRIAGSFKMTGSLEVFGRVENLFDERYQELISYATPGTAVYGGLRFVLP
jgi:vitamin B12 transporter